MNVLIIPEDFRKDQFILHPIVTAMFTKLRLEGWNWGEIRQERDAKERYFNRLVETRGLENDPGGGRKTLGVEAARKYRRISSRCREDVQVLERRIEAWLRDQTVLRWEEALSQL